MISIISQVLLLAAAIVALVVLWQIIKRMWT